MIAIKGTLASKLGFAAHHVSQYNGMSDCNADDDFVFPKKNRNPSFNLMILWLNYTNFL